MSRTVVVELLHYRAQFDDWVAGGQLKAGSATCLWRAHDNLSGFGWDIEPVAEERGWHDLSETEAEDALAAIERALRLHRYEYEV